LSTSTFLSLVAAVSAGTTLFGLPIVVLFVDVSRVCTFSITCVLSVTVGTTVVCGYDNPLPNSYSLSERGSMLLPVTPNSGSIVSNTLEAFHKLLIAPR
ncbi:hypothetical protein GIB67_015487, partial [Kingdonia uniflora]